MNLRVGQSTRMGAGRAVNQDTVGSGQGVPSKLVGRRGQLFAVADGFGKEKAGTAASAAAVRAVTKVFYTAKEPDAGAALVAACQQANQAAAQAVAAAAAPGSSGTTLTAATIRGASLHVAHVGDSRAYLVRRGELRRLTHDHTRGADLLRSGKAKPEQVAQDPARGQLSRVLGCQPEFKREAVEHLAETLLPGDTLLLCTDGLTDLVRDNELAPLLAERDPQAAAEALVGLAEQRGLRDDVSVVVVQVGDGRAASSLWGPLLAVGGLVAVVLAVALLYPGRVGTTEKPPAPPPLTAQPGGDATPEPSVAPPAAGGQATSTRAPIQAPAPVRAVNTPAPGAATQPPAPVAQRYIAPKLVAPADNTEFRGPTAQIRLNWEPVGALGPNDAYVVITEYPHGPSMWLDYQQTRETEFVAPAYLFDQIEGDRRVKWRVAVWRDVKSEGNRLVGTAVSPESEARTYVWQAEQPGPRPSPTPTFD